MRFLPPASLHRGSETCLLLVALLLSLAVSPARLPGQDSSEPATSEPATSEPVPGRPQWTTSRVVGSPEPPPLYTVEQVWTSAELKSPLYVAQLPGTEYLLVVLQGGEEGRPSRVLRLEDDPQSQAQPVPFLEVERRLIYGLTFHPNFASNGYLYVFTNGTVDEDERVNRVSRYTVSRDAPYACDPASERTIIEWRSMGHDGGDLVFGHDGMLYITSGDGTSDSDGWVTGQDVRDLNGGVLRLQVDNIPEDQPYVVPPDNPFLQVPGARGELWAFGLRNPWRMSIDSKTGRIWVGNNGQDLWETAHLLRRGENYGWSVYEGGHPFHAQGPIGPTPPVPPTLEHSHAEARSLTGGVVYHGDQLPDLEGVYVYGDLSTGKIWGARHDGEKVTWHRELADTSVQVACFATTRRGDLLVVDYGGGLYRIVPARQEAPAHPFPTRLSETGLFQSTQEYRVETGVVSYRINAPGWHDGATSDHYLAVPGDARIDFSTGGGGWSLPEGSVLVQTLSLPLAPGGQPRRLETRLMTRQLSEWVGYSYRWNDEQTDAELVGAKGEDLRLQVYDPAAPDTPPRTVDWRIPSRSECMNCHARAVGYLLSMNSLQLNCPPASADPARDDQPASDADENPLKKFLALGLYSNPPTESIDALPRLANPYDPKENLEARARSYLHANCAVCHIEAGGGNARMNLSFDSPDEKTKLIEERPLHDTFGLPNAMLVAPGAPDSSVLYHRISQRGRGQMPPLVSHQVDEGARQLFHDWILSLQPRYPVVKNWQLADLQPLLEQVTSGRSHAQGEAAFQRLGCAQCHRFQGKGGGAGPTLEEVGKRLPAAELLEALVEPSRKVAPEFATTVLETSEGQVLQGRVLEENAERIVLQTASSFGAPLIVPTASVDHRSLSPVSVMPAGMLDTLQPEQILDLIAYLQSAGDASAAAFRAAEKP